MVAYAYRQYIDPSLKFTDAQKEQWDPQEVAQVFLDYILRKRSMFKRAGEFAYDGESMILGVAGVLKSVPNNRHRGVAIGLCKQLDLMDFADVKALLELEPNWNAKEGKQLTREAHALAADPLTFMAQCKEEVVDKRRRHVSLQDAAEQARFADKPRSSMGNKLTHQINTYFAGLVEVEEDLLKKIDRAENG